MIRLTRRAALGGAALLPLSLAAPSRAQAKFPDKPIRLIIPGPPAVPPMPASASSPSPQRRSSASR
jgi:hypothetical protein